MHLNRGSANSIKAKQSNY